MALQSTRFSVWFRSQLYQKHHQLLQTRKLNLFNLFGFGREPSKVYSKSGRAVILDTTSLEDDEDGATLNVDLTIENDYSPKYDPSKHVIIRNYSSCLTFSETEAMITAQKATQKTKNGVIGQTFAGIIECIPDRLISDKKTFPYEIGDRVWGVSPETFGHCWSDYVPVPYKSISHAPINIPLHFCGLYPLHLHSLKSILSFSKLNNLNDLKNKSVLFIGTGRRSMINIFAPFLKHLDEENKITIIDDDIHSRFNENLLKEYVKIDNYYQLKCDDDGLYDNQGMMELINQYYNSFDIVIDSWAMDKTEILENCKFVTAKGTYFWRQNHMTQFNKNVNWRMALEGAKYLTNIQIEVKKKHNGVRFIPNMDNVIKGGLDDFTSYLTEMSFPIIIDKMYNLDDIQSAFNYAFNNDDSILGENIGVLIEKENDSDIMFFEESCRPKIIKLPSINNNKKEKIYHRDDTNINTMDCIDDIIEHENNSSLRSNDYGFIQDKTEIVDSQTIAKNISNKS